MLVMDIKVQFRFIDNETARLKGRGEMKSRFLLGL